MKTMKFPVGAFLEMDDLKGGRKVVLVGKDGVTFWDSVHTDLVTPVVIHPVFNPVELGTMVRFIQAHGLTEAAIKVRSMLRARLDPRADDALFIMRALWSLADTAAFDSAPSDEVIQIAMSKADEQERSALSVQQATRRCCDVVEA